jgi:hypothetical protein
MWLANSPSGHLPHLLHLQLSVLATLLSGLAIAIVIKTGMRERKAESTRLQSKFVTPREALHRPFDRSTTGIYENLYPCDWPNHAHGLRREEASGD